ncbi:cytochrome c oxidase subunit 3 [Bradyrhizobium sp. STM 3561]|jgi:cytochrome c oxidase subunit 3|uniref:cytochrome c oxidase subunit 3 n=1 Tax=Bradyrhizobium sp. STM 3561 TaxID=578923 RepID=UPI00388D6B19
MSDASSLLREPWDRFERQRQAGKFGIWIFLASETLFFGALMLTYAVCRIEHPDAFAAAGRETNVWYGTMNTAILLTSSLTMAVASQAAAQSGRVKPLILSCLGATVALGLAFIVLKGFEYKEDIDKHLVPGAGFALSQPAQLFYGFYWLVTGVHAIHLTIGIAVVARLVVLGLARRIQLRRNPELEVTALYWHLVDVVWIFLYPLIYLPGRA